MSFIYSCLFSYFTTLVELYELLPFDAKHEKIKFEEERAEKVWGNDRNFLFGIFYKLKQECKTIDPRLMKSDKFFKIVKLNAKKLRVFGIQERRNRILNKQSKSYDEVCRLISAMR